MKTRILILVMVFVGLFTNAQKLSRSKVQITDLKNVEILKTDAKGNVIAGKLPIKGINGVEPDDNGYVDLCNAELSIEYFTDVVFNVSPTSVEFYNDYKVNELYFDKPLNGDITEEHRFYLTVSEDVTIYNISNLEIETVKFDLADEVILKKGINDITNYFKNTSANLSGNDYQILYLISPTEIPENVILNYTIAKRKQGTTNLCESIETINNIKNKKIKIDWNNSNSASEGYIHNKPEIITNTDLDRKYNNMFMKPIPVLEQGVQKYWKIKVNSSTNNILKFTVFYHNNGLKEYTVVGYANNPNGWVGTKIVNSLNASEVKTKIILTSKNNGAEHYCYVKPSEGFNSVLMMNNPIITTPIWTVDYNKFLDYSIKGVTEIDPAENIDVEAEL